MENIQNAEALEKTVTTRPSKLRLTAYWICTGLVTLESAAGAQWDLVRNEHVTTTFNHLGLPLYLLTILGTWKIGAVAALLTPKFPLLKEWAYAGLFFLFTGAAACHFAAGDPPSTWLGVGAFVILVVASWALRP